MNAAAQYERKHSICIPVLRVLSEVRLALAQVVQNGSVTCSMHLTDLTFVSRPIANDPILFTD